MAYPIYRPGDTNGAMARQALWSTPNSQSLNTGWGSGYQPIGQGAILARLKARRAAARQQAEPEDPYLKAYMTAYQASQDRELGREATITQGYEDRRQRGLANLRGLGERERRDVYDAYNRDVAQSNAHVQQLGLGNTTVGGQRQQGIARARDANVQRVNESLRRERLTTDAGLSGDKLLFQERPNTLYPDLNLMTQLASAAAQSQAYGSGNGSFGAGAFGAYGGMPVFAGSYGMPTQAMSYGSYGNSGGYGGGGTPGFGFSGNGGGGTQGGQPAGGEYWRNYRQMQLLDRNTKKMTAVPPWQTPQPKTWDEAWDQYMWSQ